MTIGIKVENEFLELQPNTKMQLELNNPFLQFTTDMLGDYSMPVTVNATPKNLRLLNFAGLLQQRIDVNGIDAALYDNDLQHSIGKLKIDQPTMNLLGSNRGQMSLYYLTGVANFYQDIKYLYLRKIDLGGDRSFTWDNYNRAGTGFWGHIHQVVDSAPGSFDYAFYPVINKQWTGIDYDVAVEDQVMNYMTLVSGQPTFSKLSTDSNYLNAICPFPYLKYVLKQAVAAAGWNIDGAILDDPDFQSITMVCFQAIDWGFISAKDRARKLILGEPLTGVNPSTITFNLQDSMPDLSVSDFLLALKNRFGWWYEFDRRNKTIHIRYLKDVVINSKVKDFSRQSSPVITKKISQQPTFYALKNEFVGEYANGAPQLNDLNIHFQGWVNHLTDLPSASLDKMGQVYGIRAENNFYICRTDPTTSTTTTDTYSWQFYAYNVYDVIPVLSDIPPDYQVGSVQVPVVPVLQTPQTQVTDITTKATTLGSEKYDAYMDFIPRMDLQGNWGDVSFNDQWGIHLVFYKGKVNNKAGQPVPFATSGVYDSNGNQVAQWSLAFQYELFDGTQVGLYDQNWKTVLDTLKSSETLQFTLYLSRQDYMQLQFNDTILVQGVKMYLTKTKPVIPFNGTLDVEAIRI